MRRPWMKPYNKCKEPRDKREEELYDFQGPVWDIKDQWERNVRTVAGANRVFRVEMKNRRELKRMEGHGRWVTCVAVRRDRRMILSGSWDGTVRRWNADTGESVLECRGPSNFSSLMAITCPESGILEARQLFSDVAVAEYLSPSRMTVGPFNGMVVVCAVMR